MMMMNCATLMLTENHYETGTCQVGAPFKATNAGICFRRQVRKVAQCEKFKLDTKWFFLNENIERELVEDKQMFPKIFPSTCQNTQKKNFLVFSV